MFSMIKIYQKLKCIYDSTCPLMLELKKIKMSFYMAIISFSFIIIGLIYWMFKKDTNPEDAGKCLKGALLGLEIQAILGILYAISI